MQYIRHASPITLVIAVLVATGCAAGVAPGSSTSPASAGGATTSPAASLGPATTSNIPTTAASIAPTAAQSSAGVVTNEGGGVAVTATWAGIDAGATFDVALDTHSGDLDSIDLADGVLRNDGGDELTAPAWSAPAGGHHRSGELRFGGDSQSFLASATWIELVLFDIGGVPERVLRWNLV